MKNHIKKYYNNHALEYIESTINCDMSIQYEFFLKYMKEKKSILDVGFGSGRDMLYFKSIGYDVYGIDITNKFVLSAKEKGLNVRKKSIYYLNDKNKYDGIWACASLLHCKNTLRAFKKCFKALKEDGIMYASFKYGEIDGYINGRYFKYFTEDSLRELINKTKFKLEDISLSNDVRNNRDSEVWINVIVRK